MDFNEVTKLALKCSIIIKNWIITFASLLHIHPSSCPVEGVIKSCYMLTRIKYFKIFLSSYTGFVMTPYFYFMHLKSICRYTKYLWIIKLSRTEVHFIFVFMSKLSYLPLLSILKNSKNGVTFETTLRCPQLRWPGVFISLICGYDFTWYSVAV